MTFNTVGTAGSLLTARWFRLLGPRERNYLHQRWVAWVRKSQGDKNAVEPDLPGSDRDPRQKRESVVAMTLLIPVLWVLGGSLFPVYHFQHFSSKLLFTEFTCFVASLIIFTFATQPYASAAIALVMLALSASFLPFYFVGHSTARVCKKLYIKRKQL